MSMAAPTTIDGGMLEGGGQILRNTVALAALLSKPVTVVNVRHNRNPPGLKPQHAAGLQLVTDICGAAAEGISKGSSTVAFSPRSIQAGEYAADPGTAGATTLLFQVSLPVLLFPQPSDNDGQQPTSSTLTLRGGTNASGAPPIDYTQHVFLPFLYRHFAFSKDAFNVNIVKRGYFPRGGGELRVHVPAIAKGQTIPSINLTSRGSISRIHGYSYVSGSLPSRIAHEMKDAATSVLANLLPSETESIQNFFQINVVHDGGGPPGSGIILWAETTTGCVLGGSALGAKKLKSKDVGTAAAEELARNIKHGGCVDEHLQDQIIIFLALAKGKSSIHVGPLTLHTKTAIWVAEQLTDAKFEVTQLDADSGLSLLTCEGIGLEGSVESEAFQ